MASEFYPVYFVESGKGNIDLENDTIQCLLVTASYTYDATDLDVADLSGEVTGGSYARQTLSNVTITQDASGWPVTLDADNCIFSGVPDQAASVQGSAAIVFKSGASDADSPLIAFLDYTNLTFNGSDVQVQFNASGIGTIDT